MANNKNEIHLKRDRKRINKSNSKQRIKTEKVKNYKTIKMAKICVQSPEVVMTGE